MLPVVANKAAAPIGLSLQEISGLVLFIGVEHDPYSYSMQLRIALCIPRGWKVALKSQWLIHHYRSGAVLILLVLTTKSWFIFHMQYLHFNILPSRSRQAIGILSDLYPSSFPTKLLYVTLLSPMHATCVIQLILLVSITLMMCFVNCLFYEPPVDRYWQL